MSEVGARKINRKEIYLTRENRPACKTPFPVKEKYLSLLTSKIGDHKRLKCREKEEGESTRICEKISL